MAMVPRPVEVDQPVAPDHWTWRTELTNRKTIDDVNRWLRGDQRHDAEVCRSGFLDLAEENDRLRAVLGHCPKSIAVLDEGGCLIGYNLAFREHFVAPPSLGRPVEHLFAQADAELLRSVVKSAGSTRRTAALLSMEVERDDGARSLEFLVATLPWREGSIGVVLAGEDRTTELREAAELRQLSQANSMGAVDLVRGIVEHDVTTAHRDALAGVRAVLASAEGLSESSATRLREVEAALQKAATLIERSTETERITAESRANVRACAHKAARLVRPLRARHRIYVDVQTPEDLEAAIEPTSLVQVLTNVLDNAIQAIEEAERPGHVELTAKASTDGRIHIRVRDDGAGFDPSHIVDAFEPFATTRGAQGHAGLGLAIARRRVEGAGGALKLLSEVGAGTVILLDLAPIAS